MTKVSYDAIDLKILAIVQRNTDGTAQDVAEQVGISTNACWRRMRALQQNGTVMNRVALLHPGMLGCSLTVFARAQALPGIDIDRDELDRAASQIEALSELHRIAGFNAYRLRILARDLADYDTIAGTIEAQLGLKITDAEFSIDQIKYSTRLPIPEAED